MAEMSEKSKAMGSEVYVDAAAVKESNRAFGGSAESRHQPAFFSGLARVFGGRCLRTSARIVE
jgi:hypothetical protein